MKLSARLVRRFAPAEGTLAVELVPDAPFPFTPGQFARVRIPAMQRDDGRGDARFLSMASAPGEDTLCFAVRMSDSAFKGTLAALAPGAELELEGPFGNFVLERAGAHPPVFLAGGVGITPVRAIVRALAQAGFPKAVQVVHANRARRYAPFAEEFLALARRAPRFRYDLVLDEPEEGFAQGPLAPELIARLVPNWQEAVFFVVGPPGMVQAAEKMLGVLGVTETRIVKEDFTGY